MAEFIMKKIVAERGKAEEYVIRSSATSTEEIGNPIYPPAMTVLMANGIRPFGKVAVQLTRSDLDKYDLFIGMDNANIRNIHRILGEGADGRVYKMMSFIGSDADVDDPWYFGGFDKAYMNIYNACSALFDKLESGEA